MNNALKQKREELNLTQRQVAERVCIHYQTYQLYENGRKFPSVIRAIMIAKVLKTTVEELYEL